MIGFGTELECYMPAGATMAQVCAAVSQRIGKPCHPQSYNHHNIPNWKAVTDGSLGDTRGIELVSPVLHGPEGIAELQKVCNALTDFGCTVSRKCGFHVHVGVEGAPLGFFKNVARLYAMFEPVIDRMMPASRRGSDNQYCRTMTSCSLTAIEAANTRQSVTSLANPHGRYHKLNLVAFDRHRTVEFRQHSGTIDPTKTAMWVELCILMVRAAMQGTVPVPAAQAPVNRARLGSKSHLIGQMMLSPNGVTAAEAMAAVGWPSVSLPQQAAICGLPFTTQRMGRVVRYYASAATAATQGPDITIDGFARVIGATPEQRAYIAQRTNDLGGAIAWAA